jgi:hypothetical protein
MIAFAHSPNDLSVDWLKPRSPLVLQVPQNM